MRIKIRYVVVPCLLLALVFCGLSVAKTLSIFHDASVYEYTIYPYDGRGELSLYASDSGNTEQATVWELGEGESIDLHYRFMNTSAANVRDMTVTLKMGPTTTDTIQHVAVASGANYSGTKQNVSYSDFTGKWDANGYCKVTLTCQINKIQDMGDGTTSVDVNCKPLTTSIYVKNAS